MLLRDAARPNRTQTVLGVASALCYATGYPLALVWDSPWGWILVTLGGVLLAALLVVTIRRIDRSRDDAPGDADRPTATDSSP